MLVLCKRDCKIKNKQLRFAKLLNLFFTSEFNLGDIFVANAKLGHYRNYSSCCCWIFRLILINFHNCANPNFFKFLNYNSIYLSLDHKILKNRNDQACYYPN